jgi:hypothetical protein
MENYMPAHTANCGKYTQIVKAYNVHIREKFSKKENVTAVIMVTMKKAIIIIIIIVLFGRKETF